MAGTDNRLRGDISCCASTDVEATRQDVLPRRLTIWAGVGTCAFVGLRLILPVFQTPGSVIPAPAVFSVFVLAFCCCAGLTAAAYCFAAFAISRWVRDLFASVGFCALSAAAAFQAVADLTGVVPLDHEQVMTSGLLYASCAFLAASFADRTWRPETRAGSWAQLAAGMVIMAVFPLLMLPDAIAGFPAADSTTYAAGSRAALLAAAFTSGATTSGFRQRHAGSRRAPAIESYFYVSLAFALLARALSSVRFDYWWLCSQVLFLKSWLVFAGAGSIENAVAHKENADRLEQMEALHDISWSLVGAKTVRELVNLLANTVREKLGAAIVAVYLADESRETLEVAAISGPDICLKSLGARYPVFSADRRPGFHSGHTARAFTTKEVQTAADVFVDVELVPWRIIARDNGCAVSVPLIDKGEASGVLNVYFSDRRQLSAERLKLLRTIAAAAAPAIENARSSEAFRAGIRELNRAA